MRALPNLFLRVINGRTIRRKLFRRTETAISFALHRLYPFFVHCRTRWIGVILLLLHSDSIVAVAREPQLKRTQSGDQYPSVQHEVRLRYERTAFDWIKNRQQHTRKYALLQRTVVKDTDQFSVEKTVYTTQTFVTEKWISPDKGYFQCQWKRIEFLVCNLSLLQNLNRCLYYVESVTLIAKWKIIEQR